MLISSQSVLYLPVSNPVHLCFVFPSSPSIYHHCALSAPSPPSYPFCLVKMADCEDMMECFLSFLWISQLTDPHAHTAREADARLSYAHRKAHASYQGLLSQSNGGVIDLSWLSLRRQARSETKHSQDILLRT